MNQSYHCVADLLEKFEIKVKFPTWIFALSFAMTVWWIPFPVNEKKLWVTPAWKWIRRTTRSSAQVETRETIISARKIIMTCHQKDLMENVINTQWMRIKWRLKAWSRGQNVMFEDECLLSSIFWPLSSVNLNYGLALVWFMSEHELNFLLNYQLQLANISKPLMPLSLLQPWHPMHTPILLQSWYTLCLVKYQPKWYTP